MNRLERLPENVKTWLAAGNDPVDIDRGGRLSSWLNERGVTGFVTVMGDGTIAMDTDATMQKFRPNVDAFDPAAPDPTVTEEQARDAAIAALMVQLDDFADKIEAGGLAALLPSLLETQRTLARMVRLAQLLAERRKDRG